jgi:AsmA protein
MRRILIWIAGGCVTLVALAGVLVTGLFIGLERGTFSERIQAALEQEVGRAVTLGPITLRPSLVPTISIQGATIANLPNTSGGDFARIDRIDLELALMPLFRHQIEVDTALVRGADVVLERDKQGRPNWEVGPLSGSGTAPSTWDLSIGAARIENARLRFADGSFGDIEAPTLSVTALSSVGTRALSGTVKLGGETMDLSAEIGPVAAPLVTLRATLTVAGATVTAAGTAPVSRLSDPGWSLAVDGTADDPRRLVALLPNAPPIPPIGASTFAFRLGPGAPAVSDMTVGIGAIDLGAWAAGLQLTSAELAAASMDTPVTLTAQAVRSGVPVAVTATLGTPAVVATSDVALPVDATLTSGNATVTLKGSVARPFGATGSGFDFTVATGDLSALSPLVAIGLPALHDAKVAGRVEQTAASTFALGGVSVAAKEFEASGDLQLDTGPRVALRGTIAATRADLDGLSGPMKPGGAKPGGRVIPDVTLPLDTLRSFDASLALSADSLTAMGVAWRAVKGTLALDGGRLALAPLTGTTAGGGLSARISVDATANPPTGSLFIQNQGSGFDIAAFRRAIGSPAGIEGPTEIVLDVRGQATTTRTFAATLNGDLGMALVNGRLFGVAPISFGPDLSRLLLPKGTPAGGVAVSCVALRLTATNGIARSQALLLEGPVIRIEGNMALDLRDETMVARLLPNVSVLGVTVRTPVTIDGSMEHPKVEVQPDAVFGRLVTDTVANRLWRSSTVEWIQQQAGADPAAHTCAAQIKLARMGRNGPVPKSPAVVPGVPQELQGVVRNTARGIGNIFRPR